MWLETECAYCGETIARRTYPSWEKRRQKPDQYCNRECSNKAEARGAVKAQAKESA